jgi:branched-chain amino acid transport system permease protein
LIRFSKTILFAGLVLYAILALLPLYTKNQFFLSSMVFVFVFALFGAAWDLGYGVSGIINLGPGLAYGIGAYVFVYLALLHYSPVLAFVLAALIASLVGFVYWVPSIRTSGTYLAIVTLILLLLAGEIALANTGEDGISAQINYFSPTILQSYYITLAIALAGSLALFLFSYSRFGLRLKAMRDDEVAAKASGINVHFYKLISLVVSSLLLGVSGAATSLFIDHSHFDYTIFAITPNFLGIVISVIGGPATIFGSIIGALIVEIPANYLTSYSSYAVITYGATLVLVVLFLKSGILNAVLSLSRRFGKRKANVSSEALKPQKTNS